MKTIDPDKVKVILATDCGSTTTKAILIQLVDGQYRQTHRGEAPSTVESPFADVTIGVINSVTEVSELAGRRLVDEADRIIQPATADTGCDLYISTSSAGGGLQMLVAGVVRQMTVGVLERGERVVILAAGAIFSLLALALWIIAIGSTITVIQRFAHAYREMEQIDADERVGLGERV